MPRPANRCAAHTARSPEHYPRARGLDSPASPGEAPAESQRALLVEDVAADGSRTERMRASGAIATTATHAGTAECIAARQTRQVAHQAAAGKGLRSVAQHSRRQSNLVLTIHNPTTPSETYGGHKGRASTGASPPCDGQRRDAPGAQREARHHRYPQSGRGRPPDTRLLKEAEDAGRSGDLRPMKYVGDATHARSPWDQFRVWDPGD